MRMRILLLCALGMMMFVIPLTTNAAQTCSCFCGTEAAGAFKVGSSYTDTNECIKVCKDSDEEVIGCFTSEADWPIKSNKCWTEEQCTGGTQAGKGNTWDDDIAACVHEPIKMGYCYLPPRTLTTIIAISGDNTFASLADYINALYKYLVPVMSIVAIIMVMVAGLQYILSRGNPSAVKAAKERIVQAVVGIVLLLSAYALARLLDPSLVNFEQLRIPMVKEVVLLDEGSKCETLALAGIEIDSVAGANFVDKTCSYAEGGVQGVITDMANVDPNVSIGQWKEGDKCDYTKCEGVAACSSTGCQRCAETSASFGVTETADYGHGLILEPSVSVCKSMQNISPYATATGRQDYCIYDNAAGNAEFNAYKIDAGCVEVSMECSKVQSTAKALELTGADGCSVYGIPLGQREARTVLDGSFGALQIMSFYLSDEEAWSSSNVSKTVCENDICLIRDITNSPCKFSEDSGGNFSCTSP